MSRGSNRLDNGWRTPSFSAPLAYRHRNLVGDDLALVLDFGEGRVLTIAENHEAWTTVLAALDRDPRNKRPSAEWRLELVAGAEDVRLDLLD